MNSTVQLLSRLLRGQFSSANFTPDINFIHEVTSIHGGYKMFIFPFRVIAETPVLKCTGTVVKLVSSQHVCPHLSPCAQSRLVVTYVIQQHCILRYFLPVTCCLYLWRQPVCVSVYGTYRSVSLPQNVTDRQRDILSKNNCKIKCHEYLKQTS